MNNILLLFHHLHHCQKGNKTVHIVDHCGNAHAMRDKDVNYINVHCMHKKHFINKKRALGHDADMKPILFTFHEKCGTVGYHVESGTTTQKCNFDFSKELHKISHDENMKHIIKHKKHLDLSKKVHVHFKEETWFC